MVEYLEWSSNRWAGPWSHCFLEIPVNDRTQWSDLKCRFEKKTKGNKRKQGKVNEMLKTTS
jgi:hypothetical protein